MLTLRHFPHFTSYPNHTHILNTASPATIPHQPTKKPPAMMTKPRIRYFRSHIHPFLLSLSSVFFLLLPSFRPTHSSSLHPILSVYVHPSRTDEYILFPFLSFARTGLNRRPACFPLSSSEQQQFPDGEGLIEVREALGRICLFIWAWGKEGRVRVGWKRVGLGKEEGV